MDLINRKSLLEIIDKELQDAEEGVTWTNAACFKNKATHLRNFKETVESMPGINLEAIIESLQEHRYYHAAEIVREAIKNE